MDYSPFFFFWPFNGWERINLNSFVAIGGVKKDSCVTCEKSRLATET